MKIAVLPGDGIGTEIVAEAIKVLGALDLNLEMESALVGGVAYAAHIGGFIAGLVLVRVFAVGLAPIPSPQRYFEPHEGLPSRWKTG